MLTAVGAAYLGASPSERLYRTWSQCGVRGPRDRGPQSQVAKRGHQHGQVGHVTVGSMSRHPPEPAVPTTTVVVVSAYELVATRTPGAISVKLPTGPVYHQLSGGRSLMTR
jgi:hypothetical protein